MPGRPLPRGGPRRQAGNHQPLRARWRAYADPRSADGKDWYGTWAQFRKDVAGGPFKASDRFLVVGCGSSSVPADLVADGFVDVTGMDYSEKAIALQKRRFPGINWVRADARSMPEFANSSFDVLIEKALMDGEGAWKQWPQMLSEYSRVLRYGGRFISISLGQPDELDSEAFFANDTYGWDVRHALSYDDYYVYTMTKRRKLGRRLRRRRRPAGSPEL
ncbi:unnamed protein product [Prorocentrum cordatum]|uniref:Methyltransferase type 11 domain-containing protein n=1 Tax=Prorocentrum cordatum TaxID=2364126 RepID=A0ABN9W0V9_9DINO|nr:unnamed protein product [Polarella glacialis]